MVQTYPLRSTCHSARTQRCQSRYGSIYDENLSMRVKVSWRAGEKTRLQQSQLEIATRFTLLYATSQQHHILTTSVQRDQSSYFIFVFDGHIKTPTYSFFTGAQGIGVQVESRQANEVSSMFHANIVQYVYIYIRSDIYVFICLSQCAYKQQRRLASFPSQVLSYSKEKRLELLVWMKTHAHQSIKLLR